MLKPVVTGNESLLCLLFAITSEEGHQELEPLDDLCPSEDCGCNRLRT